MNTQLGSVLFAGLIAFSFPGTGAAAEEFFAELGAGGNIVVVDASGDPIPVVYSDPVGTRPANCPSGSYYFTEMDTDNARLALTDCATGQGSYEVTIHGSN